MPDARKSINSTVLVRWFVLAINDALAAYLMIAVFWSAPGMVRKTGKDTPKFWDVQSVLGLFTSVLSGHVYSARFGCLQRDTQRGAAQAGARPNFISTTTLMLLSFAACATADIVTAAVLSPVYGSLNGSSSFSTLRGTAADHALPSAYNLVCYYFTQLAKLAVMVRYAQSVEHVRDAIQIQGRKRLGRDAGKTTVTVEELRRVGNGLGDVLELLRGLGAFSFLVLLWYAELMLAIVSSVHIGLSYLQNATTLTSSLSQIPRNVFLVSLYVLLSHRLCSVHSEGQGLADRLSTMLSRVDARDRVACVSIKVLRRACAGHCFALSAWEVFHLDDHLYMNTLTSVLMYGVILQQLTTVKTS